MAHKEKSHYNKLGIVRTGEMILSQETDKSER